MADDFSGEFDAERAARLIENLRTDKEALAAKVEALTAKAEAAEKAQAQAAEAVQAAQEAVARAEAAEKALWTERALRKHPLPAGLDEETEADLRMFLSGDDEETITKRAERLAALVAAGQAPVKPQAQEDETPADEDTPTDGEGEEATTPPGLPKPGLTPGHGGDAPEPFDAGAVARDARRAGY